MMVVVVVVLMMVAVVGGGGDGDNGCDGDSVVAGGNECDGVNVGGDGGSSDGRPVLHQKPRPWTSRECYCWLTCLCVWGSTHTVAGQLSYVSAGPSSHHPLVANLSAYFTFLPQTPTLSHKLAMYISLHYKILCIDGAFELYD